MAERVRRARLKSGCPHWGRAGSSPAPGTLSAHRARSERSRRQRNRQDRISARSPKRDHRHRWKGAGRGGEPAGAAIPRAGGCSFDALLRGLSYRQRGGKERTSSWVHPGPRSGAVELHYGARCARRVQRPARPGRQGREGAPSSVRFKDVAEEWLEQKDGAQGVDAPELPSLPRQRDPPALRTPQETAGHLCRRHRQVRPRSRQAGQEHLDDREPLEADLADVPVRDASRAHLGQPGRPHDAGRPPESECR